ncbi:MAG: PAS and helix-turn-helix domain-containing protein [Dehalococcoidia bacterium]
MNAATPEPLDLLPAFERAGDGVFVVDHDERIVFWNDAAERILGFKPPDVLGRRCYEIIAGPTYKDHPVCGPDCVVIDCARRGRPSASYDVRALTVAGQTRLINVSIVVLRGRRPTSTLAVHLFRDVTHQRAIELRIQQRLEDATAGGADGLMRAGHDLTRREAEVLRMLACGLTDNEIAEALVISPRTVRNHIEHVLAKMSVHSRLEAVVSAAKRGIL